MRTDSSASKLSPTRSYARRTLGSSNPFITSSCTEEGYSSRSAGRALAAAAAGGGEGAATADDDIAADVAKAALEDDAGGEVLLGPRRPLWW